MNVILPGSGKQPVQGRKRVRAKHGLQIPASNGTVGIGKNVEGVGRGSLLGQGVQPVNEHQPPGGKPLGCVGYAACGGILGQPGGDTARQGKGGADRGHRLGDGLVKAIALRLWAYKKANAGQQPQRQKKYKKRPDQGTSATASRGRRTTGIPIHAVPPECKDAFAVSMPPERQIYPYKCGGKWEKSAMDERMAHGRLRAEKRNLQHKWRILSCIFGIHEISDVGWHALGYEKEGWSIST